MHPVTSLILTSTYLAQPLIALHYLPFNSLVTQPVISYDKENLSKLVEIHVFSQVGLPVSDSAYLN